MLKKELRTEQRSCAWERDGLNNADAHVDIIRVFESFRIGKGLKLEEWEKGSIFANGVFKGSIFVKFP